MSTYQPTKLMLAKIVNAICPRTTEPMFIYSLDKGELRISGIHPTDEGRIIGRIGATWWALTTVHKYACDALGIPQVRVMPLETGPKLSDRSVSFRPRDDWDKKALTGMIESVLSTCLPKNNAWVLDEHHGVACKVQIPSKFEAAMEDPNFEEAIDILIHCAGKGCGVSVKTEVEWA